MTSDAMGRDIQVAQARAQMQAIDKLLTDSRSLPLIHVEKSLTQSQVLDLLKIAHETKDQELKTMAMKLADRILNPIIIGCPP